MIGKVKLRKEYKEQTGEDWKMLNPTAQPTIDYVKWLESKLIAIPDDVGRSEQLVCEECKEPMVEPYAERYDKKFCLGCM